MAADAVSSRGCFPRGGKCGGSHEDSGLSTKQDRSPLSALSLTGAERPGEASPLLHPDQVPDAVWSQGCTFTSLGGIWEDTGIRVTKPENETKMGDVRGEVGQVTGFHGSQHPSQA